jgi:small-conductance mechanosensitive channel
MAFLNIPSIGLSLAVVAGILLLYTILWVVWWRPAIMKTISWGAKARKHNQAAANRFATIAGTIATFVFFVGYVPLAALLVHWFGLWDDPTVEGGKVWAGIGLVGAYLFQSHFFSLTLGGIKVLLLRSGKKGDYIEAITDYGVVWARGTIMEIDTHGTKLRDLDGSVHTMPNEKVIQMDVRNFDHDKFHHWVFQLPVRDEPHAQLADRALSAITTVVQAESMNVARLTDDDKKWYEQHVERSALLTTEQVMKGTAATFRVGFVDVRVPIRKHIDGIRLESELISLFPELFGDPGVTSSSSISKEMVT